MTAAQAAAPQGLPRERLQEEFSAPKMRRGGKTILGQGPARAAKISRKKTLISHTVRCADGNTRKFTRYGRKLAMSALCTECMGWDRVDDCTARLCPLWPYRARTQATRRGSNARSHVPGEGEVK